MVCTQNDEKGYYLLRDLVLRIYWDNMDSPWRRCPWGISSSYLHVGDRDIHRLEKIYNIMPKHGLYRFHVMDPIMFESDLRRKNAGRDN
jgi:hypothetical protein